MTTTPLPPSEEQQTTFDEEMQFLASIQSSFANLHEQVPVEYDDPDVKRLTQAMAAFMANGRMAGKNQIDQLHQRVFQQLLPYIASPMPSMGMLKANTRYLTEASHIKSGTAFSIATDDDEQAQYRSLHAMPLAPIAIKRVGYKPNSFSASQVMSEIIIDIKAHTRAPGQLTHLPLYLSVNHNYQLSLQFKQMLAKRLLSFSAIFDETTQVQGQFAFGPCAPQATLNKNQPPLAAQQINDLHPIEQIRRFFQLPQQENHLNLYFDEPPLVWNQCQLVFHLNASWPKTPALSTQLFHLGVIAVENILQEQAAPFTYNGTQSSHALRPPSTAPDLSMLKCLGVYQGAVKDRQMLRPGILKGGNGSYEINYRGTDNPHIDIQYTQAFSTPIKVNIEAIWHQPEFSKSLWKKLSARTLHLDIPGLSCTVMTVPVPQIPRSTDTPHSLMELSILKNKDVLSLEEIVFILDSFGSVFIREFRALKPQIKNITIQNGHQYYLELEDLPKPLIPLFEVFCHKLQSLLRLWLPVPDISVSIHQTEHVAPSADFSTFAEHDFIPENIEITAHPKPAAIPEDNEENLIPVPPESFVFFETTLEPTPDTPSTKGGSQHEP
ncbi:type VI secretion system baseplate subunit TssF [Paraglaciecola marina]|uniref:type VI secretion system baseplate subunit TssF n=1 Tax=Paraglaciecola marina TaxID=2500157 RepID=UPI00105FD473|nr:type VI secretion system baseplate subunit TssF [Paraglaciecola marina]